MSKIKSTVQPSGDTVRQRTAQKKKPEQTDSIAHPTGEIRRMKLSDLKPAEYNPRVISDSAKAGLTESLTKFGMLNLVVWNERTGNVVGGHQRLKVLQDLGETETDVMVVNLGDKHEQAMNIALNNKFIQGDYSQAALEQLKSAQVNLGEMFDKLQLQPLVEKLEKKVKRMQKKESPMDYEVPQMPPATKTEVLVVCPECHSKWRMSDGKVVEDNSKKDKHEHQK